MTTIGYGDRGPQNNPSELMFVIFAEVVGLSFFAVLLSEIVNVYNMADTRGKEQQQKKNQLIQFLKFAGIVQTDPSLVRNIVKYLNFKATRSKTQTKLEDIGGFSELSQSLQDDVRRSITKPQLKAGVRFFGHSREHTQEVTKLKKMVRVVHA